MKSSSSQRRRHVTIVTPAPRHSRKGNRFTATRWAGFLRDAGYRVDVVPEYDGRRADLLLALHARKSHDSVRAWTQRFPEAPCIVVLTGTDLYRDLGRSARARKSIELADRLIVLHPRGADDVPQPLRSKVRVVVQSAEPFRGEVRRSRRTFDVAVVGHLRSVKDPFRAALAARRLPAESRVRIVHLGAALSEAMEKRAREEMARNPRYVWRGDRPPGEVRRTLASSRAFVLSSVLEGGANVLSEAIAARLPVLASRIAGSTGLLGDDHPGLFDVRDTRALATLLRRVEADEAFRRGLAERSRRLAPRVRPGRERDAILGVVSELL